MLRRTFLAAAAVGPCIAAETERVLDTHLHLRADPESCFTHMQGCGVTHAVLLTRAQDEEQAKAEAEKRPGVFARSVAVDPAAPGAEQALRNAIAGGAIGIGEIKYKLAVDSPEMRRFYEVAADFRVPLMMHIESYPGAYSTGYEHFDAVLKAYPKTHFIGHGPLFWAHISADVPADKGYPSGPVKRGGLTDRWLTEFPNLYADMSANSGRNALMRDEEFARDFLTRQQDKLIFGSDCPCTDGNGGGTKAPCIARATLGISRRLASPEVFRKITWENGVRVFRFVL
jgi:predicted TIM-barrel fold metal-dependent hydrolase